MTYIYLGHGNDILLKKDGDYVPAIRTIPDNCTLSTITESGLGSDLRSILNLCTISQQHPEMLNNPMSHLNELNRKFNGREYRNSFEHKKRLLEGQYHLKVAGKPFINKYCDFLFEFKLDDTTVALFRSGLYDISTVTKPLPVLSAGKVYDTSSFNINIKEGITKDVIVAVYDESIYPTSHAILEYISKTHDIEKNIPYKVFVRAVRNVVVDDLYDILYELPGHHYFFGCKIYANNYVLPLNRVEEIRQMSKNTSEPLEELSPVQLQSTRKGGFAFKHVIYGIFIKNKLPSQTLSEYNYEGYIHLICKVFDMVSPDKIKRIEFVNDVIDGINAGLGKFTLHDIHPKLLSKIIISQEIEGVHRFEG
jgi:hypothetical protein